MVLLGLLSGCTAHREVVVEERTPVVEHEVVVEEAAPPERVEVITVRPYRDAVWIRGHYIRERHRWLWVPGHWR
jgi:hypothetical protein